MKIHPQPEIVVSDLVPPGKVIIGPNDLFARLMSSAFWNDAITILADGRGYQHKITFKKLEELAMEDRALLTLIWTIDLE